MSPTLPPDLWNKLMAHGQEHLARFHGELDPARQKVLERQIAALDFETLARLHVELRPPPARPGDPPEISPPVVVGPPGGPEAWSRAVAARATGEAAIRAGAVAALQVAGGQGTRLGFAGPKGAFPFTAISGKTLFEWHADKIRALSLRHGARLPWYVMTSLENRAETEAFFQARRHFGVPREDVRFFTQGTMPAIDFQGRLLLGDKGEVFTSPNGHGGVFAALQGAGALADMRRRGIRTIFFFQVDNALLRLCDPLFLGYHLQAGAEFSCKVVRKTDPAEKVGVVVRRGGRHQVIEYSDLPADLAAAADPATGRLLYDAGSIAIHAIDLAFAERMADEGLPYHAAKKAVPHVDEAGRPVRPLVPNAVKFEMFVFDAMVFARESVIQEVDRAEEFSPVKNAEGADSPATARRDLSRLFASWFRSVGIDVPEDFRGALEVSPLLALDREEFVRKATPDLKARIAAARPWEEGKAKALLDLGIA